MTASIEHIHIDWEGPYSYEEALSLHASSDYGVYQIYGSHPAYGSDVLVYIGKADAQRFGKRLSQENWSYHNQDSANVKVYVGRLAGYEGTPEMKDWSSKIAHAERLLIYSHWPAGNSSGLHVQFSEELHYIHVLNWGRYRDLLPEVSGARYSDMFYTEVNYALFKLED